MPAEIAAGRRRFLGSAAAGGENDGEYDVQDLIDSEVTLTHWTGPDGTRLEEASTRSPRWRRRATGRARGPPR